MHVLHSDWLAVLLALRCFSKIGNVDWHVAKLCNLKLCNELLHKKIITCSTTLRKVVGKLALWRKYIRYLIELYNNKQLITQFLLSGLPKYLCSYRERDLLSTFEFKYMFIIIFTVKSMVYRMWFISLPWTSNICLVYVGFVIFLYANHISNKKDPNHFFYCCF